MHSFSAINSFYAFLHPIFACIQCDSFIWCIDSLIQCISSFIIFIYVQCFIFLENNICKWSTLSFFTRFGQAVWGHVVQILVCVWVSQPVFCNAWEEQDRGVIELVLSAVTYSVSAHMSTTSYWASRPGFLSAESTESYQNTVI